jgi:hypothetical protein
LTKLSIVFNGAVWVRGVDVLGVAVTIGAVVVLDVEARVVWRIPPNEVDCCMLTPSGFVGNWETGSSPASTE